jgi:hypothetical protein
MYPQDRISDQIRNAKLYGQDFLETMLEKESFGEDIKADKTQFIVLIRLIEALQRYYEANYDDDGEALSEPTETCLDTDDFDQLMLRLQQITGGAVYVQSDWLLSTGQFADSGYWRDNEFWRDF